MAPMVACADEGDRQSSITSIEGAWGVTKCEASGKPVELPWTWIFKPEGKVNLHDRRAGKQSVFKYSLDRSQKPLRITLEYLGPEPKLRGSKQLGILKRSQNVLVMCLGLPDAKAFPTEFKTTEVSGFLMALEYLPTE